jgi:hypothetical protein
MSQHRNETEKDSAPKPYVKPELKEFGDVAALTQAVSTAGANDGGMSLMTKT